MKPAFLAKRSELENKPRHGEPCNRCGLCCRATLCALAQHLFERPPYPGPCPALVKEPGDTYSCGILNLCADQDYRDAALLIIGAGLGCDARFNGEPSNRAFNDRLAQWDRDFAEPIAAARRLWGMP